MLCMLFGFNAFSIYEFCWVIGGDLIVDHATFVSSIFMFWIGWFLIRCRFVFRDLIKVFIFSWTVRTLIMGGKYIIPAIVGSFAVAWACDHYIADRKIFGG